MRLPEGTGVVQHGVELSVTVVLHIRVEDTFFIWIPLLVMQVDIFISLILVEVFVDSISLSSQHTYLADEHSK